MSPSLFVCSFIVAKIARRIMEKEAAVMSRGGRSHQLRCCHIGTKTEQLSGRK